MTRYLSSVLMLAAFILGMPARSSAQDASNPQEVIVTEYHVYADGSISTNVFQGGFQTRAEADAYAETLRREHFPGRIGTSEVKGPPVYKNVRVVEVKKKTTIYPPLKGGRPDEPAQTPKRRTVGASGESDNDRQAATRFKDVLEDYLAKLPPAEQEQFKARFLESLKAKGRDYAKQAGFSDSEFDAIVKQAETTLANTPSASSYEPGVTSLRRQYDYDSDGNRNSGRPQAFGGRTIQGATQTAARKGAGDGPFKAKPRGDVIIPGKYHFLRDGLKTFATYEEAMSFLNAIGYDGEGEYILLDKDGNRVNSRP